MHFLNNLGSFVQYNGLDPFDDSNSKSAWILDVAQESSRMDVGDIMVGVVHANYRPKDDRK